MRYWILLLVFWAGFSVAKPVDIPSVIDGVVRDFGLRLSTLPEFKSEEARAEKYQRAMKIGAAYLENKDSLDALRKYVYAYRMMPDQPDALFMVGTILIELRGYESAVAIFEYLEERYPSDFRLNNNLGWIFCTATDPRFRDGRKAESYATKALLHAPQDYHVWSTLAEARYVYGNFKAAARAAKQALMLAEVARCDDNELAGYRELVEKCARALEAESEFAENADIVK